MILLLQWNQKSFAIFLLQDICCFVWSTQFGCLPSEKTAWERWWWDSLVFKTLLLLVPSHLYDIISMHSHFFVLYDLLFAAINVGVAGCCTGLALSFPGKYYIGTVPLQFRRWNYWAIHDHWDINAQASRWVITILNMNFYLQNLSTKNGS